MRNTQHDGAEYSVHYLAVVSGVTVIVAALAWLGENRSLAMAAAVLGLYALHILSVRVLLEGQRRQQAALQSQWELLQKLVAPEACDSDAEGLALPVPEQPSPRRAEERRTPDVVVAAMGAQFSGGGTTRSTPPDLAAGWLPDHEAEREGQPDVSTAGRSANGTGDLREDADGVPPTPSVPLGAARASGTAPETATEKGGPRLSPSGEGTGHVPAPSGERSRDEPARRSGVDVPIPRHFALGTVALIRNLLTPAEVARILLAQREQPEKKFATIAVEMGLLTEAEREELLLAQAEGLFTDAEMREARQRLREFRESTARALSELA